jgi:hypothetical protein
MPKAIFADKYSAPKEFDIDTYLLDREDTELSICHFDVQQNSGQATRRQTYTFFRNSKLNSKYNINILRS